ncbi:Lipoyl synthase, mitochondrial, partial [Bonamia ostreae]
FNGKKSSIAKVVDSNLDVFAHNVETVEECTRFVRDRRANYQQSLNVLEMAKKIVKNGNSDRKMLTKTSLMLGVGERDNEIKKTLIDLRQRNVDVVTFGQYLRPTKRHMKVFEYVKPEKFEMWKDVAEKMGFLYVASGPLVRSSYKAGEYFLKSILRENK